MEWTDFKQTLPKVGDKIIISYKSILGTSTTKQTIWTKRDEEEWKYNPLLQAWRHMKGTITNE